MGALLFSIGIGFSLSIVAGLMLNYLDTGHIFKILPGGSFRFCSLVIGCSLLTSLIVTLITVG